MPTLYHYFNNAFTYTGSNDVNIVPGAHVTLYANQSTSPLLETIYGDAAGLTTKTNPFDAKANGDIEFWLASAKYVRVKLTGTGVGDITMDFQPVLPDPAELFSKRFTGAIYLNDPIYSNGLDIASGAYDAMPAFANAFADALALSSTSEPYGALIVMGPGRYNIRNLVVPSGVMLIGSGPASCILRRKNYNDGGSPASNANENTIEFKGAGSGIARCRLDGNYATNADSTYGMRASEVYTSTNCTNLRVDDFYIINYNANAWNFGGTGGLITNLKVYGVMAGQYFPDNNYQSAMNWNLGSFQGLWCSGVEVVVDNVFNNVYVQGTRLSGFAVGGENTVVNGLTVWECHRGDSNVSSGVVNVGAETNTYTTTLPSAPGTPRPGVPQGGSQVTMYATKPSSGGANGTQNPYNCKWSNIQIRSSSGSVTGAMEIYSAIGFQMTNYNAFGVRGWGLHMSKSDASYDITEVVLDNIVLRSCESGGLYIGNGCNVISANNLNISFMHCSHSFAYMPPVDGAHALEIAVNADFIRINGVVYRQNDIHYYNATSTGNSIEISNQVQITTPVSGDPIRNKVMSPFGHGLASQYAMDVHNFNPNGLGVRVRAGSSAAHTIAQFSDYGGNLSVLMVAGTNPQTYFNTSNSGAAVRPMVGFMENGIAKGFLGLGATDQITITNTAGTSPVLLVDPVSGGISVNHLSGSGVRQLIAMYGAASPLWQIGADTSGNPVFYDSDGSTMLFKLDKTNSRVRGTMFGTIPYTPTLVQGAVTITVNSLTGYPYTFGNYGIVGNRCFVAGNILVNNVAGASAPNDWAMGGLPAAALPLYPGGANAVGTFVWLRGGVGFKVGAVIAFGSGLFKFVENGSNSYTGTQGGGTLLAVSDVIQFTMEYEVASS